VDAVENNKLVVTSVLSGNRNFEGPRARQCARELPRLPAAGGGLCPGRHGASDLTKEPIGTGKDGQPVYLKDIWPTQKEVSDTVHAVVTREMFQSSRYGDVFKGPAQWQAIRVDADSDTYRWNSGSTYVQNPPYFEGMTMDPKPTGDVAARASCAAGDSITTDHISPAGSIKKTSPAGDYLMEHQVRQADFNSYGARRGNHQVMMRGTFANIRIKNEMVPGVEGGISKHYPSGDVAPIYDAAMRYKNEGVPLVVIGGKEYGTGSSRDWAAKGTYLLGVKAVIAESFERIHRSNLVGMGVLPLCSRTARAAPRSA
jgi:aconitate hydratase